MFSDHPHRAPDASFEAMTNQLASLEKQFDRRHKGGFDVHECICAMSSSVTRAWRSHYVWQLRRLDLKGASMDVRDACEQCGERPWCCVYGRGHVFIWRDMVWILVGAC